MSNLAPRILVLDRHHAFPSWFSNHLPKHYDLTFLSDETSVENESGTFDIVLLVEVNGREPLLASLAQSLFPTAYLIRVLNDADRVGSDPPTGNVCERTLNEQDLQTTIEGWLSRRTQVDTRVEVTQLRDQSAFVRSGPRMRQIDAQARLVAGANIPVLILGESGTGKEVLAKYIHEMSPRRDRMFLKVNCAAMPADLLESELFGHEQGAFTGAYKLQQGKFEICQGGTLFLDEIGEMPVALQAKLLHVLQDGTFSRLGARSQMKADVRIVAATNVDVKASIADKTLREDLYYRLNGFSFTLPPLRERPEEIPAFAEHFMRKCAAKYNREPRVLTPALIGALCQYRWPGNLRELENLMTRFLMIGSEEDVLSEIAVDKTVTPGQSPVPAAAQEGLKQLARSVKGNAEALAIAAALEETHWNRTAAAKKVQISYKALLYKIKQYEIVRGGAKQP